MKPAGNSTKRFLTVAEVATLLSISLPSVYRLIENGRLDAHRFGIGRGAVRIGIVDLDEFIASCKTEQSPRPDSAIHRKLKHLKF